MKFTEDHYKVLFVADKLQDLKDNGMVRGGYACVPQTKDLLREGKMQGFADPSPAETEVILLLLQDSLISQ